MGVSWSFSPSLLSFVEKPLTGRTYLTGMKKADVIGHTAREIMPDLENSWIELYGKVAMKRQSARFENHTEALGKTYEVSAFSPVKGQFATIFKDITEKKKAEQEISDLLEFNQRIVLDSDVGILVYRPNGACILANPASARITGGTVENLINQNYKEIPSWKESGLFKLAEDVFKSGRGRKSEIHILTTFGRDVWMDCMITRFRSRKETMLLLLMHDITDRKEKDLIIGKSEERLKLALFAASQGLFDINLNSGEFVVSLEYASLLGYQASHFRENLDSWFRRMHPDDRETVRNYYKDYLEGRSFSFRIEFRQKSKEGRYIWILALGNIVEWDKNGDPVRLAGTITDISERKETERKLEETRKALEEANHELEMRSNTDGLTGIPNRRFFDESYRTEWLRARRYQKTLAVIMIDIDYFKRYNDTFGHMQGDECLKSIALAISASIRRPPDLAARYGGEEFIILLPETSTEGAKTVSDNIRKKVAALQLDHPESLVSKKVTVSMGIADCLPDLKQDPSELIIRADQALYRAKENGRNRIEFAE